MIGPKFSRINLAYFQNILKVVKTPQVFISLAVNADLAVFGPGSSGQNPKIRTSGSLVFPIPKAVFYPGSWCVARCEIRYSLRLLPEFDMESNGTPPASSRAVFLTVVLCFLAAAPFVILLAFLTYGIFLFIIPLLILGGALAGLHYLLWGKTLNQEVAGEREELKREEAASEDDWHYDGPASRRRF